MSGTPSQNRLSMLGSSAQAQDASSRQNNPVSSSPAQSFIADFITSSLPASSVDSAKQALSLRTTTLQFTRFVQKAGPIFAAQDAIEKVFRWQDPAETLVYMSVWALICMETRRNTWQLETLITLSISRPIPSADSAVAERNPSHYSADNASNAIPSRVGTCKRDCNVIFKR